MSGKKKKPVSSWVLCDKCCSYMHERDVEKHSDCLFNDVTYPYIRKGVLHCLIEPLNEKELPAKMSFDTSSLIFISNCALQLCEIPLGSWVVISTPSGGQLVRKAWKGHDRMQLSASLTISDCPSRPEEPVTIQLLSEEIEFANEVIVAGEFDSSVESDVMLLLQQSHKNKILCKGNTIHYIFYGKAATSTVVRISSVENHNAGTYFKTHTNTQWIKESTVSQEQSIFKPKFVGSHAIKEEIDSAMALIFQNSSSNKGGKTRGIVLSGVSGTGKSMLLKEMASKWGKTVINISSLPQSEDASAYFSSVGQRAMSGGQTVITIDELDVICGKSSSGTDSKAGFALAALFDRFNNSNAQVAIIATTSNINGVSKCLRRPGRFDKELEIGPPTPQSRLQILLELLGGDHSVTPEDMKEIADRAHGFVGADLSALISKAVTLSSKENKQIHGEHLRRAFPAIRPSAMREVMVQVPNVKWEEVGGQDSIKHQLRQAVEWPLKYPESFKRLGVSPPRGLLMYGPPGCSKTMIAKALATESGLNFFSVKGPELFSCWVGDSEKAVREVFRRARQAAPAIVFFDELDALAGERAGSQAGSSQVQERVLAQLLTELDGVEALGDVIVVGATNRPDRIDPALLRPGRLDRVVYVPLPDPQTRLEIFKIQFQRTLVSSDVDVAELVAQTEGYSGAEVVGVCREAAMEALSQDINAPFVSIQNFIRALEIVTPRTSESSISLCEKYKNMRLL